MASEAANFETNFVGSAEQDISATENELTQVEANIASLTEQLGQASTRKSELDSAVIAKKAELAKAKIDFASTSEKVRGFYTNLVSKMTKYIGA
jgi:peptidoglycan hydrolase CwlO-like protein